MTAPKRRWFRWSLRTMFVVVTMCAFAALLISEGYQAKLRREYVAKKFSTIPPLRISP